MDMIKYQQRALETAIYPTETKLSIGLIHCALKMSGEVGEFNDKLGKHMIDNEINDKLKIELIKELGDILWYLTCCAHELGTDINVVANLNLVKLSDRMQRNKIFGDGDNR